MQKFANLTTILVGKTRDHLIPLSSHPLSTQHYLQAPVVQAFLALQQSAQQAGFNLQAASTYRDFERQKHIWNTKFNGDRKVHDDQGNAIDMTNLTEWEKCQAILRWSAVPGASRHHWGTEIDIFDPDRLPQDRKLMLEPWEYQAGGYFESLTYWLNQNAEKFGFYFPFLNNYRKQIGLEPWHLSYHPIADLYRQKFNAEILQMAWKEEDIAGKECLIRHFDELFTYFIL